MTYYKKQRKHTRSIYLNTDDAYYTNADRTIFSFRFAPVNIEDESRMYVKNTNVDYKTAGLSVKNVQTGLFLGSTATYSATYSVNPSITFVPQDGKGTGATAIGVLAPSGASGSATSSTLVVNPLSVGQGYTGTIPTIAANVPNTGGTGATLTPAGPIDSINGGFSAAAATLVAGSGYTEAPTFTIPAPQASVLATFAAVPHTASTGVITGVPAVLNTATNGFYGTGFFSATFVNNPVTAFGVFQTNATGGITGVIIENAADNGYYGTDHPITLPFAVGGTGFTFTPTYSSGRCVSIIVTNAGSGYGNNLIDYPFTAGAPATPVAGTITGATLSQGRLTALTTFTGGSKYKNPTITTSGIRPPIQAVYEPVFKQASALAGVRMLTHGRGYNLPPKAVIDSTFRVANNGDLPLITEITPSYLVDKSNYYTIKIDGVQYNRALYTNTDNKGLPTLAICSTNEIINNEDYTDLVIPAQVINDITLDIRDKDGLGVEATRNMIILIIIEELEDEHTDFEHSKRQLY
jgi:hypothetical protein